jgi:diacylglycerol O-acyltransferase / wax synthase
MIERLTTEDLVMLWPDQIWPQDIGALVILDGRGLLDAAGELRLEAVMDVVAGRLHHVPRFRQVLYVPPKQLGRPLWVDAAAFDLSDHVKVARLPAPGGEAQLLAAIERLRRNRLDRSRPLWEMWFLTGMPDGRVAMFVRTHHSVADGIAGVATLGVFLDTTAAAEPSPPQPWTPAPAPSEAELLADAARWRSAARRRVLSRLAHPAAAVRAAIGAWPALSELLVDAAPRPTSLDRAAGPDRRLALIRSRLGVVKALAHLHGAKVNDVLLTLIAGGLRALLVSRGEPVDGVVLRIYVPVSMRHGQYEGARGNQVAQMVVPLPVGIADPAERLRAIAAVTALRKSRSRPSVGSLPIRGIVGWTMLKLIEHQRVNVESADLPGPPVPLYFAGARLLEVFPLLPLIGRVSIGVGALSYAGQLNIAAIADLDGYPDLEVFASGVRHELEALEAQLHRTAVA